MYESLAQNLFEGAFIGPAFVKCGFYLTKLQIIPKHMKSTVCAKDNIGKMQIAKIWFAN